MVFVEQWHGVQTVGSSDLLKSFRNSSSSKKSRGTPLFDAIQSGNWTEVDVILRGTPAEEPKDGDCECNEPMSILSCGYFTDEQQQSKAIDYEPSPSGKEQAATWVVGHDAKKNEDNATKKKWKQLPLHAAISGGAPIKTIAGLVKAFPEALQMKDTPDGNLPLHLAMQGNCYPEKDMLYLIQAFPKALKIKNKEGQLPAECGGDATNLWNESVWSKYQLLQDKQYATDEADEDGTKSKGVTILQRTNEAPAKKLESISPALAEALKVDEDPSSAKNSPRRRIVVFPGLRTDRDATKSRTKNATVFEKAPKPPRVGLLQKWSTRRRMRSQNKKVVPA